MTNLQIAEIRSIFLGGFFPGIVGTGNTDIEARIVDTHRIAATALNAEIKSKRAIGSIISCTRKRGLCLQDGDFAILRTGSFVIIIFAAGQQAGTSHSHSSNSGIFQERAARKC